MRSQVVASLLKRWLRALPEPLLPPVASRDARLNAGEVFASVAHLPRTLAALVLRIMQRALDAAPAAADEHATAEGLCVALAPALLHCGRPGTMPDAPHAVKAAVRATLTLTLTPTTLTPTIP